MGVIALCRTPLPETEFLKWEPLDLGNLADHRFAWTNEAATLIHLAWGGLPNYRSERHEAVELPRQQALIDATVERGVQRMVIAGTCLEYGMQEGELSEEHGCRPGNPYAAAKDQLRRHAESACGDAGCSLVWARLFYLFGHGQAATSLWTQLSDSARRGERRFPMSGGQQVRDFMPATAAAADIARLALGDCPSLTINVCSGVPRTVEGIVRGWIDEHGWSIEPELGRYPYPDHEPFQFWGSRRRLDGILSHR